MHNILLKAFKGVSGESWWMQGARNDDGRIHLQVNFTLNADRKTPSRLRVLVSMITVLRLNEINSGPNTHTMHDTGAKDIAGSETGTKGQVCRRGRGRGEAGSRESIGFDERILRTCKQRKKSLAVRCTLLYIETVYIVD